MVTVIDFKQMENKEGEKFCVLILQGGIEMVKSQTTNRYYATARRCSTSSTFDEATCKALIGEKIPGTIKKVKCEEYEFAIPQTGEVIKLDYRWDYTPDEVAPTPMVSFSPANAFAANGAMVVH